MEHFVITIITKSSILDVAAVLDPPLDIWSFIGGGGFQNFDITLRGSEIVGNKFKADKK